MYVVVWGGEAKILGIPLCLANTGIANIFASPQTPHRTCTQHKQTPADIQEVALTPVSGGEAISCQLGCNNLDRIST